MQSEFELQRTGLLEQYGLVEGLDAEESFINFTKLACTVFNVPMAAISIVADDHIWIKASYGIEDELGNINDPGLCSNVIASDDIYIVEDTLKNPETLNHSWVKGSFGLRFYVGFPLITKSGFAIGSFCLMDKEPGKFSDSQIIQFSLLATLLVDYIEKQHEQNVLMKDQRTKIRTLAHDLKNPLTIVTLQAELLMDENNTSDDIIEMSQQISVAGRKINDIINKHLFS